MSDDDRDDEYKYWIAQFAVKSIDLEDHLRKDHLLMEVQVNFEMYYNICFYIVFSETATIYNKGTCKTIFFACLAVTLLVPDALLTSLGDEKTGPPQLGQPQGYFLGEK